MTRRGDEGGPGKPPQVEVFPWSETAARLDALLARWPLETGVGGRHLMAHDDAGAGWLEIILPLVLPPFPEGADPRPHLHALPSSLGRECVLLIQAGATALGLWERDRLVAHKVIRKYVVRGRGRAQPLHLKTRGKSRYGSRLRLANSRAQLAETNERLRAWWDDHGSCDRVFYSCPVRTWPELFRAKPPPPFARDASLTRVPLDVKVPSFGELRRVRFFLTHGRIVRRWPGDASPG